MTYILEENSKGIKTLLYTSKDGKKTKLHSAYNPVQESERLVQAFTPGRSNIIIVFGLGLAYHIKELKKKYPLHKIIVLEYHKELIDLNRKNNTINFKDIFIFSSLEELSILFEDIDISKFKGFSIYTHIPSYNISPEFYNNFIKDINKYISSKISDLLTRFEFEKNWVENILKNIHNIYLYPGIENLFGKFKGYTGIIVSAGPSLRKNVHKLKELKDKTLIIAVDTALKVLLKNDITPHMVMVLDAQKHSIKHFLGLDNYSPYLIADVVSYPGVLNAYKGKKFISTTAKYYNSNDGELKREPTPFMDWVEKYIDPIGDIQSGGSVATSLFDFLLNAGCSQIVLVGQDLAYSGREIHSTGTHHNEGWLSIINRFNNLENINQNVIRKRKISYIDSYNNKNKKVISDFVLDLYRHWFEDSSSKVNIPVINSTEGGANIKNTLNITLSELCKKIKTPQRSADKIISDNYKKIKNKNADNLKNGITGALNKLDFILKLSTEKNITLFDELEKNENYILLSPFIKKTIIYINRNDNLSDERKIELLSNETQKAAMILKKLLENTLNSLNNITDSNIK